MAGPTENSAYAALRQLHYLFQPQIAVHFTYATAVCENLHAGDIVIAAGTRRVHIPPAIVENMFHDDNWIFPGSEQKEHVLAAPPYYAPQSTVSTCRQALESAITAAPSQSTIESIRIGCGKGQPPALRGAEFLRQRFHVEAVDSTSYGFARCAADLDLPSVGLATIDKAISSNDEEDFRRYKERFLRFAAKSIEACALALLQAATAGIR
jgi:hypothetical protein